MKLEKLNENQIRCTLSKADLDKRELRLSELAYGSAKARALFRDMIKQASVELGFEVDNIPLMIEAIPVSSDCLVLVVTKVEDPEELDTRFSRFSNLDTDDDPEEALPYDLYEDDDFDDIEDGFSSSEDSEEVLSFSTTDDNPASDNGDPFDLLAPLTQAIAQAKKEVRQKHQKEQEQKNHSRIFQFHNLDRIIELSALLVPFYDGESILCKNASEGKYYLLLAKGEGSAEHLKRACTIASDFGERTASMYASLSYFKEHCDMLFSENALQMLHQLNE